MGKENCGEFLRPSESLDDHVSGCLGCMRMERDRLRVVRQDLLDQLRRGHEARRELREAAEDQALVQKLDGKTIARQLQTITRQAETVAALRDQLSDTDREIARLKRTNAAQAVEIATIRSGHLTPGGNVIQCADVDRELARLRVLNEDLKAALKSAHAKNDAWKEAACALLHK